MPMQLIETTISDESIMMRLANNPDRDKATEWLTFSVPARLAFESAQGPIRLPFEIERVAVVQQAVLRYVREAIAAETQRLSALLNR